MPATSSSIHFKAAAGDVILLERFFCTTAYVVRFYATARETRASKKVYSLEKQILFATRAPRSPVLLMNFTSFVLH